MAETSIIIVNYNGSEDTAKCILSLLNCNSTDFNIIIVENASQKDQRHKLVDWLNGKHSVSLDTQSPIAEFQKKYLTPDFKFQTMNYAESVFDLSNQEIKKSVAELFFVKTETNNGFAAGNNIGLRLAEILESNYVWLLNNDTEVHPDSLKNLMDFSKEVKAKNGKLGLVGAEVLFYDRPEIIQSLGGLFNPFISKNSHFCNGRNENEVNPNDFFKIDYPYGASIFTDKEFIAQVGFMQEDYFLLYEELDWTIRGRRKGFPVRVCLNCKVYHKQGNSMGRKMDKPHTPFTACLRYRNFLKLYRRFFPYLFVVAYLHLIYKWMGCIKNGKTEERIIIQKVFFGFSNCNIYKPREMKN